MVFSDFKLNKRLVDTLKKQIAGGNVHHAYIFEGPLTANKEEFALAFAQALLCREKTGEACGMCDQCRKVQTGNHIDVKIIRAEPSKSSNVMSIKDDDIEKLIKRILLKPVDSDRNIIIICDADTISPRAANRFLKTLEEPPVGTVIMLLSENVSVLPQTIVSRCEHMRIMPERESAGKYDEMAKEIVSMVAGNQSYTSMKSVMDKLDTTREEVFLFLDCLEDAFRDELVKISGTIKREQIFKAVEEIEIARKKIKGNVIVHYALKSMILAIGG